MAARVLAPWPIRAAIIAAIVVGLLVSIGECLGRPVGLFDESLYYVGAMLMARGERVHVDFHSSYLAPNYQLLAWTFRALGETAFAARLLHSFYYLVLLGGIWSFYRRLRIGSSATSICLLAAVVLSCTMPSLPSFPAVATALLAIVAYLHATLAEAPRSRRLWLGAAGALAGCVLLQRISWGGYVAVLFCFDGVAELVRRRREGWANVGSEFFSFGLLGGALALSAVLIFLTLDGELGTMRHEVISIPATAQRSYSMPAYGHGAGRLAIFGLALPLLPLAWLIARAEGARARLASAVGLGVMVPLLIWCGHSGTRGFHLLAFPLWLVPLAHQVFSRPLPRSEFLALTSLAIVSHYYLSRPDFEHLVPSAAPLALLMPFLFFARERQPTVGSRAVFAAGLTLLVTLPMVHKGVARLPDLRTAAAMVLGASPRGSDAAAMAAGSPALSALYPDESENEAARFVRERSKDGDAVYVGMTDHSRTFVNDMRLYWLLGRSVGTRQYMLAAKLTDTAEVQQEIIRDLHERQVRWVVLWQGMPFPVGFEELNPRGSALLDDHLARHFRPLATFGEFTVKVRAPLNGTGLDKAP